MAWWPRRDGSAAALEHALGRRGGAQHALIVGPEGCGKYATVLRALARLDGDAPPPEDVGTSLAKSLGLRPVELKMGPRSSLILVRSRLHVDLDVAALEPHAHKAAVRTLDDAFSRDADLIIVLRRAHALSEDAQEALRCIIERPGGTIRFWLTARPERGRILAPIASRLTPFYLRAPDRATLLAALVAGAPQPVTGATAAAPFPSLPEPEAAALVDAAQGRLPYLFASLRSKALRADAARLAPPGAPRVDRVKSPASAVHAIVSGLLTASGRAGAPTEESVEALAEALTGVVRAGLEPDKVLDLVVDAACSRVGAQLGAAASAEVAQAAFELSDVLHRSETPILDLVGFCVRIAGCVPAARPRLY